MTNLLQDQLVPTVATVGVFLLKEQTNNEITANKIEEAKET